jgi:hypothetical protein
MQRLLDQVSHGRSSADDFSDAVEDGGVEAALRQVGGAA